MRALERKLLRDIWQYRGQALAIAAVIAAGVALFVLTYATLHSLELTQSRYYERYRFADLFVSMKRAPLDLAERLREIPGVAELRTRVVVGVTLAAAFDMEGGFNDAVFALTADAREREVVRQVDDLLARYGGGGAVPRRLQTSHWYLQNELNGLRGSGLIIPLVFLGVAAFLLQIVLVRLVASQREQIATLKALGYSNRALAWHFTLWSLLVAMLGALAGVGVGIYLGESMTRLYTQFFHFPILVFGLQPQVVVAAFAISAGAASIGALRAVRAAVALPPAEAMRPAAPARYRPSLLERLGIGAFITEPTRIILRNLSRHPIRAAVSTLGVAMGGALVIVGTFSLDAMDRLLELQFRIAQRQDLSVTFFEPVSSGAFHEIGRLPGVLDAQAFRSVPVRLRHLQYHRTLAITGIEPGASLYRVIDADGSPIEVPPDGLLLSRKLAETLHIEVGDVVTLEVLEGRRPHRVARVSGLADEMLGMNAYMDRDALHRLMREDRTVSGAHLAVDSLHARRLYHKLKRTPRVAGVAIKDAALQSFEDTMGESIAMMRFMNILFAGIIVVGVAYNNARIALAERERELATLRVIGFRRFEIATILIGELALLTVAALPLALLIGSVLSWSIVVLYDTEVFRMPFVISRLTFTAALLSMVAASALSALLVRRKLDRLDLVAVLKTRE